MIQEDGAEVKAETGPMFMEVITEAAVMVVVTVRVHAPVPVPAVAEQVVQKRIFTEQSSELPGLERLLRLERIRTGCPENII